MSQSFADGLEKAVTRFYEILSDKPRAYHEMDGESPSVCDVVTVVFQDGEQVTLRPSGRGPYDYTVMARPKYSYPTTAEQIKAILREKAQDPCSLRYRLLNENEQPPSHEIIIEFPWDFVSKVLRGELEGPNVEIPYTIVGGILRLPADR